MIPRHADQDDETLTLRSRLAEADEMLEAIRHGEIDALVVESPDGNQVYTLHTAEEPYRHFVEQMHEGAVLLTRRGEILYANGRFAELVGEPLESLVGTGVGRFVVTAGGQDFATLLNAGTGRHRATLVRADASTVPVSVSLTAAFPANRDRVNLIVTDLTELLEAGQGRDVAETQSRAKDGFLALVAHELRSPLGAISNAVQVLALMDKSGGPAADARAIITRQVAHVTVIVNELLDLERVVSGKVRLHREPFDMAEAVNRAAAGVSRAAGTNRAIEIHTQPVWIDADAVRVAQVVTNLLTNAVKYTPAGGRIRVDLRAEGGDAVFTVDDTGAGISPGLLPFIFDPYVQAERTLDRADGGLGLGLTLVRRLVELHGGTVEAASAGEGLGSRFTVRLKQVQPGSTASAVPLERRARPRRVLVIGDREDARERLQLVLERAGHDVYAAPDAARGLELMGAVHPDVGIIDLGVANVDGYKIAERIRDDPHGRGMLLLALSDDVARYASRQPQRGFDDHLVRPIDPERLIRLLSEGAGAGTSRRRSLGAS